MAWWQLGKAANMAQAQLNTWHTQTAAVAQKLQRKQNSFRKSKSNPKESHKLTIISK